MSGLSSDLDELRKQLEAGSIQRAYEAILGYMSRLRSDFAAAGRGFGVSGLYQGSFDMTYFALYPPSLRARDLKIAVVFDYASFTFQIWLAARNRALQRKYHALLAERGWSEHPLIEPARGVDAITVFEVAGGRELEDEEQLKAKIHGAVATFTSEVERFLIAHDPPAI